MIYLHIKFWCSSSFWKQLSNLKRSSSISSRILDMPRIWLEYGTASAKDLDLPRTVADTVLRHTNPILGILYAQNMIATPQQKLTHQGLDMLQTKLEHDIQKTLMNVLNNPLRRNKHGFCDDVSYVITWVTNLRLQVKNPLAQSVTGYIPCWSENENRLTNLMQVLWAEIIKKNCII